MALKKYVPRSIQNIFDRLEAFNESITDKLYSEELVKTFEVIVYCSKNPETKTTVSADSADLSPNVANYNFFKARSLAGHHDFLIQPERARSIDEYERLRNLHFQAIIKKSLDDKLPQTGDVWLATQTGANMVSLISFERSGDPRKYKIPEGTGPAQQGFTGGNSPTSTVGATSPTTTVGPNGPYSTEIQAEIDKKRCHAPKVKEIRAGTKEFIAKIKASPSFTAWSGQAIAGLVANASEESAFRQLVGGDPLSLYERIAARNPPGIKPTTLARVKLRAIEGKCSWGYWQLNICPESAAGSLLAKNSNIDVTTLDGKLQWKANLANDEFQFAFVASRISSFSPSIIDTRSAYDAGSQIVLKFEKPACMNIHALERGNLAVLIYDTYTTELNARR